MPIATPGMEDAYAAPIYNPVGTTAEDMTAANAGQAVQAGIANAGPAAKSAGALGQEQLAGILNKGGALMQQSATMGNQQAASRGLLNSSMGVQAAQNAMISNAMPLAQSDANLIQNNQQWNAGAENQMNQYNASNVQQGNQWNAGATNAQNIQNAGWQQQANSANQSAENQNRQWNAANQNDWTKFNAQNQTAMNQWNAGQQNEATLKAMDINSRESLANIEANYKQLMQVNSSAENMYNQVMKNINDIQTSETVTDKQTAINSQLAWLRQGMSMVQNLNGVSGLITF